MSVVDSMALAAAEQVELTAGPKAGLAAWKTLVLNVPGMATRARAILGALRCAVAARDVDAIDAVIGFWRSIKEGDYLDDVRAHCASMRARGYPRAASDFARAESERWPTAASLVLWAECLAHEGRGEEALAPLDEAASRAAREGHAELVVTARVRHAAILAASPTTLARAVSDTEAIDLSGAAAEDQLRAAAVLLRAPGRFVRARALGTLEALVRREGETAVAREATLLAVRHVDAIGLELSRVEADHVTAILACWPREVERVLAIERVRIRLALAEAEDDVAREAALARAGAADPEVLRHLARARAVLGGAKEAARAPSGASSQDSVGARLASHALDAVVAIERQAWDEAARALEASRAIVTAAPTGVPPALATALSLGLRAPEPTKREATRLAEALLARQALFSKLVPLALALHAAGRSDLAREALRVAHARREPGAAAEVARTLATEAWRVAEEARRARAAGRMDEARRTRRRARALFAEAKAKAT